jgi:hypothetical protein
VASCLTCPVWWNTQQEMERDRRSDVRRFWAQRGILALGSGAEPLEDELPEDRLPEETATTLLSDLYFVVVNTARDAMGVYMYVSVCVCVQRG